jgi:murein L,D-transpeptidase YafK
MNFEENWCAVEQFCGLSFDRPGGCCRRGGNCAEEQNVGEKIQQNSRARWAHFISVALDEMAAAIILAMRTRLLTGMFVLLLCGLTFAQTNSQSLHADRVIVLKKERLLELLNQGKVVKTYKVALGGAPVGPKTQQGDHKTPEGVYVLDSRNVHSHFYKAIHISYPNAHDRAAARERGVSPGGDVFLHGLPNGYGWVGSAHRAKDWTDGCIAVTNQEIDEIWSAVPDGTPIEIRP